MKMYKVFKILYYLYVVMFILLVVKVFLMDKKNNEELYSISIVGSTIEYDFKTDKYEYDINVDSNDIYISCDTNVEINGCNISLDLTEKKEYTHKIKVNTKNGEVLYTLNIKNLVYQSAVEPNKFYIKSVNGNPTDWVNGDVILEVIMSDEKIYMYSFDGGLTWQENNKFVVTENKLINIIVRTINQEETNVESIEISKIDKVMPDFIVQKTKNNSNVLLKIMATDLESGIDSISYNGGAFDLKDEFIIKTPGKYTFKVKDKAGNISLEKQIEVTQDDFNNIKPEKEYILTLEGNGSKLEKTRYSCKTTKNSCEVVLPDIITQNIVLGWDTSSTSKNPKYKVGEIIKLDSNLKLYAITKKKINPTKITIKGTSSLTVGSTANLTATISPSDATDKSVTWTSSNTNIVTVYDNGKIKANKTGIVTITATSTADKNIKGTYTVTVNKPVVLPTGITIKGTSSLTVGSTANLTATISPSGATDKSVTWTSSDTNIVTVYDNGKIKANKTGTATITATSTADKNIKETYTVTVNKNMSVFFSVNKELGYIIGEESNCADYSSNGKCNFVSYFCKNTDGKTCTITTPKVFVNSRKTVEGWNTKVNGKDILTKPGEKITVNVYDTIEFDLIVSEELTATFDSTDLDYIQYSTKSCKVYNTETSCAITLPYFNKKGYYNLYWGTSKNVSSNLIGQAFDKKDFNEVGHKYNLTKNITLYPNFNYSSYTDNSSLLGKYRTMSVGFVYDKVNSKFEFDSNIPRGESYKFRDFINYISNNEFGWLFSLRGKVFVMHHENYEKHSTAYGVTHGLEDYYIIDIQYDDKGFISQNVILHELAHAWDKYYKTVKGKRLSQTDEFYNMYIQIKAKTKWGEDKLNEAFADMFTNYYWHIKGYDDSKEWYGITTELTEKEKNAIKSFFDKYCFEKNIVK